MMDRTNVPDLPISKFLFKIQSRAYEKFIGFSYTKLYPLKHIPMYGFVFLENGQLEQETAKTT
jgi:hypothetical protein